MQTYGECSYSFTILDFGTRWRWAVSFTPLPLYLRYPLDRSLSGFQNQTGRCGEEKNLALAGNQTPDIQPVTIPFGTVFLINFGELVMPFYFLHLSLYVYQMKWIFSLNLCNSLVLVSGTVCMVSLCCAVFKMWCAVKWNNWKEWSVYMADDFMFCCRRELCRNLYFCRSSVEANKCMN
jgi:hypothetical protein